MALAIAEGADPSLWIYDQQRDVMTRLTSDGVRRNSPVWTPNGQYIVFDSVGSGIFWTRADGASFRRNP